MAFDLLHSCKVANPIIWVLRQQQSHKIFYAFAQRYLVWKLNLLIQNTISRLTLTRTMKIKRRTSHHHLIEQHSKGIVVDLKRMSLLGNDLRTHVFQTATKGVSFLFCCPGQSKVCNLNMSFEVNHNILWFYVPIDYVFGMQVLDCEQYFYEIFFGLLFSKTNDLPLKIKQLPTRTIIQDHHVVEVSLYELFHLYYERKGNLLVDDAFIIDQFNLPIYLLLLHELCSIEYSVPFVSTQVYLAKSTHPNTLEQIVSLQSTQFLILVALQMALQHQITSNPPFPLLDLVVTKPISIFSLQVTDFFGVLRKC